MTQQATSKKRLKQANLNIVNAENQVDAQRALIARLEASGASTVHGRNLLQSLILSLEVAKTRRQQLLIDMAG